LTEDIADLKLAPVRLPIFDKSLHAGEGDVKGFVEVD
jgi:pantothenate kinase-related protein Tda10